MKFLQLVLLGRAYKILIQVRVVLIPNNLNEVEIKSSQKKTQALRDFHFDTCFLFVKAGVRQRKPWHVLMCSSCNKSISYKIWNEGTTFEQSSWNRCLQWHLCGPKQGCPCSEKGRLSFRVVALRFSEAVNRSPAGQETLTLGSPNPGMLTAVHLSHKTLYCPHREICLGRQCCAYFIQPNTHTHTNIVFYIVYFYTVYICAKGK